MLVRLERAAFGASIAAIALGLVTLCGWALGLPILTGVIPGAATMKVNTAFTFVLGGVALSLQLGSASRRQRQMGLACGAVVFLIGALTLAEYRLGSDLGIDGLLLAPGNAGPGTTNPWRMAPMTALCFTLCGAALTLLDARHRGLQRAATAAAVAVLLLAYVALVGYTLSVGTLYTVVGYASMSIHTAVGFAVLSIGVLIARPERALVASLLRQGDAAAAARRLLPAVIVTLLAVGWLRLRGERAGFYGTEFGLAIMVTVCTIVIGVFALWNAHALGTSEEARLEARADEQFLFELGEVMRSAANAEALLLEVSRRLGSYLRVSRCAFCEIDAARARVVVYPDHHEGLPSLAGPRSLDAYSPAVTADVMGGQVVVSHDTNEDPRTAGYATSYVIAGIRARVTVPIMRDGQCVSLLFVSQHEPRNWQEREVSLVKSVAARIWLSFENLSATEALRQRELDLAVTMNSIGDAVITTDPAGHVTTMNPVAERLTRWTLAEARARPLHEVFHIRDEETAVALESPAARALRERSVVGLADHTILVARDGAELPITHSAAPILDFGDALRGVVLVFRDATAERGAKRALQASEASHRDLYENAPDLYASVEARTGIVLSCNRTLLTKLGHAKEDVVGRPVLSLYEASSLPAARAALEALARADELNDVELDLRTKDGHPLAVSLNASVLRGSDGRAQTSRLIWRDITLRKRAEREQAFFSRLTDVLRSSTEQRDVLYRVLEQIGHYLGVSRVVLADIDAARDLVTIERDYHAEGVPSLAGTLALSRFASPEAIAEFNRGCTSVNDDTLVDRLTSDRESAYRAHDVRAFISVPLLRDGRWEGSLVVSSCERRSWKQHEIAFIERVAERAWLWVQHLRLLASIRDLKAQEALRESNERFRAIVEAVDYGIVTLDREGRVLSWNRGAEKLKGYRAEEAIGQHFSIFYEPEARREGLPAELLARAVEAGQAEHDGWRIRKDGSRFWATVLITVLRDASGAPSGFVKIIRDITERRRAEEELSRRAEQLKANLKEREVLLQEVHHRVKNNLQVIASLINMQLRKLDHPESRRALEECQSRVKAIALIHEKLYQSKDYAEIPFSEYAKNLAGNIFHTTGTSSTRVKLRVDIEPMSLAVDRAIPCGLILNELITNALKHGFPEERCGHVSVELHEQSPGRLMLVVGDDGVGIPPGFDLSRASSLGMKLVSTLVEQLDGQLEIGRERGTRFEIAFPAEVH